MLAEREKAINGIEELVSILSSQELPISEEDKKNKLEQLKQGKIIVQNKKYHVTTLGIFSTGKSTLINSMLGGDYLPAADNPTTARITEIRPAEKAFIIFQTENVPTEKDKELARKFLNGLGYSCGENGTVQILTKITLEAIDSSTEEIKGVVITGTSNKALQANDVKKILTLLGTETNKADKAIGELVEQFKKVFKDITVGLPVSDWMSDIILTDAPGTGSIVESHEKVINQIIPESQLVLHIVDAERIGDSTDSRFAERIAIFQHRKIFYIMNKIDRMASESCDDAEIELKKCFPPRTSEDCAPEVIRVSALSALLAMELKADRIDVKKIMDNRKLSLGYLWSNQNFREGSNEQQKKMLYDELWEKSNFAEFQDRVATYLRKENKEMAIIEDAWKLVYGFASDVKNALDKALHILHSDTRIKNLEQEQKENEKKREELKKTADRAIGEYKIEINGGVSTITGKSYDIAGEIKDSLKSSKDHIESELRNWLYANDKKISQNPKEIDLHIQELIERAITAARNVAERQATAAVARLKEEIVDVLNAARDISLVPSNSSDRADNPNIDTSITLIGLGITGLGVGGGAGMGAGIGAGIGSIVPGFGTALGASIGAGVGALVGLITGGIYVGKKKVDIKINKIIEQVNSSVQKIFFDGGILQGDKSKKEITPYLRVITVDLDEQCNRFSEELQKKIELRFKELNKRESALVKEITSSKQDQEAKIRAYSELSERCNALLKRA